ncbi:MAG: hypothetical protein SFT91_04155 [Rickettsiaceae bacterium]|nr:hypothetical protein [Rickettsiaceae bacterium]
MPKNPPKTPEEILAHRESMRRATMIVQQDLGLDPKPPKVTLQQAKKAPPPPPARPQEALNETVAGYKNARYSELDEIKRSAAANKQKAQEVFNKINAKTTAKPEVQHGQKATKTDAFKAKLNALASSPLFKQKSTKPASEIDRGAFNSAKENIANFFGAKLNAKRPPEHTPPPPIVPRKVPPPSR